MTPLERIEKHESGLFSGRAIRVPVRETRRPGQYKKMRREYENLLKKKWNNINIHATLKYKNKIAEITVVKDKKNLLTLYEQLDGYIYWAADEENKELTLYM